MKKIKLTQGKHALVDDEDYLFISQWKWFFNKGYAFRSTKNPAKTIPMHRAILCPPIGTFCDHINGNGLDNRRKNLRVCSNSENQMNRRIPSNNKSGYKGVFWHGKDKIWISVLKINKKAVYLDRCTRKIDAAKSYDVGALKYFGEFARLNFPKASRNLKSKKAEILSKLNSGV